MFSSSDVVSIAARETRYVSYVTIRQVPRRNTIFIGINSIIFQVSCTNCRDRRTMTSHNGRFDIIGLGLILRLSIPTGCGNNDCRFSGHDPAVLNITNGRASFFFIGSIRICTDLNVQIYIASVEYKYRGESIQFSRLHARTNRRAQRFRP